MATTSAPAISGSLDRAYRAALLLTGSAQLAEIAVLNAIASLEFGEDLEKALIAKTVEFVIRRPGIDDRVKCALARQPHDELRRLICLRPESRDSFLLRVLFGISSPRCAAILNLTIEELQASLSAALWELSALGRSDIVAEPNTPPTGGQK